MTRLSFISGLLALSCQTALAVDVIDKASSSSSTNNLRGAMTINDADTNTIKPKAVSGMPGQVPVGEEPKTSSLERAVLDTNPNEESIFSPDFEVIPSPRIVNGGRATRGRYPYYVSIYTDSWWGPPSHSCGGSLIAPDVVLCAGAYMYVQCIVMLIRFSALASCLHCITCTTP